MLKSKKSYNKILIYQILVFTLHCNNYNIFITKHKNSINIV